MREIVEETSTGIFSQLSTSIEEVLGLRLIRVTAWDNEPEPLICEDMVCLLSDGTSVTINNGTSSWSDSELILRLTRDICRAYCKEVDN